MFGVAAQTRPSSTPLINISSQTPMSIKESRLADMIFEPTFACENSPELAFCSHDRAVSGQWVDIKTKFGARRPFAGVSFYNHYDVDLHNIASSEVERKIAIIGILSAEVDIAVPIAATTINNIDE